MRVCSLAALAILLLCTTSWAQAPSPEPWQPPVPPQRSPESAGEKPRVGKDGKPLRYVDGVPDTGQFLPDSAVIGRIDDKHFTVGQFRDRWFASYALDRPKPDSAGRFEFLNSMVNKEVLAALAQEVNRPFTFEDRSVLREHERRVLSNVTFKHLVADSAQPTAADLQHAHEQWSRELRLQQIITPDRVAAERARDEVLSGQRTWPEAVERYSTGRGDKGPEGDLGWMPWDKLDPIVALEVYDLEDGSLSRIHGTRAGWRILRVAERRPVSPPALEAIARVIANRVHIVKREQRKEEVRDLLRKRIGMTYDTTNITMAAAKFLELERKSGMEEGGQRLDLMTSTPEFAPDDTGRVLARWNGGRYTLGNYLEAYHERPVLQRPKVGSFEVFRSSLDAFALEPFTAELAVERGYDRDPMVTSEVAKKEEQIRVEHLFADSVLARVWVPPEERREYYRAHLPEFFSWQSVRIATLVRRSKAGADSVVERLGAGEPAASILRADSLAGFISGAVRTVNENDRDPYHQLLFEEMREGDIRVIGPDPQGEFAVVQKLAHDPGRQLSYEEVANLVDESLHNLKAEESLKQFLARHRAKHEVELHPELLMRIRLTDPSLD
jgi:hypothetical protein